MALPEDAPLGRGGLPACDRAQGRTPRRRGAALPARSASSSISPTAPHSGAIPRRYERARPPRSWCSPRASLPYLTETDVAELADDLKAAEKIRYWIVDYYSPEAIRYGEKMRARFMRNAPFRFTPQDWFGFFASHGWRPREVRYLFDEARRLGRPIPLPWFCAAVDRDCAISRIASAARAHESLCRLCDARTEIIFSYREAVVAQPE